MASVIKWEPKLWPKQGEALSLLGMLGGQNTVETLGYGGAKGGGKSYLARTWQLARRLKYANSTGLLIRESFPELERTHIQKIQRELPKEAYSFNGTKHTFTFPNGSVYELGYADNDKAIDQYWGAEYDDIVIDEAQYHSKYVYQTLRSCLRTTNPEITPKFLLTFNWGGIGFGWLKRMFWRKWMKPGSEFKKEDDLWDAAQHWEPGEDPAQFAFLHAKVWDNPSIVDNDPGYVKRLEALPEQLRKAYLDGDPDVFEGQFFTDFGRHLSCDPFYIQRSDSVGHLFGSLDSGIEHYTSFGLWYIVQREGQWHIFRLLTYLANGGSIREHAKSIYDAIESFPWTYGMFPGTIWYDNELNRASKMSETYVRTGIQEYLDVFKEKSKFTEANKEKLNRCFMMKSLFAQSSGYPVFRYWRGYNSSFEEGIPAATTDRNRVEIYKKQDGDDVVDEAGYGIIGCMSEITQQGAALPMSVGVKRHNVERQKMDWRSL